MALAALLRKRLRQVRLEEINGWHEHKKLVMQSLERQHEINTDLARQIVSLEKQMSVLATKMALVGAIAGIVTSATVYIAVALIRHGHGG